MPAFHFGFAGRIRVAFAAALVATGIVVASAWLAGAQLARSADTVAARQQVRDTTAEIATLARENAVANLSVLVSPSTDEQKRLIAAVAERNTRIEATMATLEASLQDVPDAAAALADVRKRFGTYRAGAQRIGEMVLAGKQAEAAFAADEEMLPMMAPFFQALKALDAQQAARVDEAREAQGVIAARQRWIGAGMGLAAAVLTIVAALWLTRSITRPLQRAVDLARALGNGDLSIRAEVRGRDEAAQLLQAMNAMAERLERVIAEVRRGSDQVAQASAQIAAGNQDLSSRTEQQASAVQQTASSMEQLDGTVRQTSEQAEQARSLAAAAAGTAKDGGRVVQDVVATMRDIESSSRRITEIIAVIDGIAFQTNILALNAAVEAARAGEQGRGFAVVASEVRGLAQRSGDAAREIRQLILSSVERVEAGTRQVDQAGHTMGEIVSSIERVSALVAEISAAATEQSRGVAQIGEAVSAMDQGLQSNAALVEQSAAAAESLRQQSQSLREMVAQFRTAAVAA